MKVRDVGTASRDQKRELRPRRRRAGRGGRGRRVGARVPDDLLRSCGVGGRAGDGQRGQDARRSARARLPVLRTRGARVRRCASGRCLGRTGESLQPRMCGAHDRSRLSPGPFVRIRRRLRLYRRTRARDRCVVLVQRGFREALLVLGGARRDERGARGRVAATRKGSVPSCSRAWCSDSVSGRRGSSR